MKNKEKFAKEILEIACKGEPIALHRGKPVSCKDIYCTLCGFNPCGVGWKNEKVEEWAEQEYIEEPEVDWSKVPVDTPVLVSNDGKVWAKRHFAKYEIEKVFVWDSGLTSWSAEETGTRIWKYAKLAEPLKNQEEKKFWHEIKKDRNAWKSDVYPKDGEKILVMLENGQKIAYWFSYEKDAKSDFTRFKAWARIPEFTD